MFHKEGFYSITQLARMQLRIVMMNANLKYEEDEKNCIKMVMPLLCVCANESHPVLIAHDVDVLGADIQPLTGS